MSEILQAGQHPDADQLNAFVEHTLPAHEQQQTLAHLAVCPHCRQIVALSLPPDDESPALEPEAVRHRWFPRWHPAWAGIPVLATLVLVILFVRNEQRTARYTSIQSQMADAHKPPPPPAASAPPEALRSVAPLAQRARQNRPVPAVTPPTTLFEARQQPPSGSAGVMGGILGGIASAPAQPPTHQLNEPGRSIPPPSASAGGPVMAVVAGRAQSVLATPGPLPSHLPILSMASRANQRLAIDTDNHLFVSNDEGRNWKAVSSQWKGRAVRVALTSSISFGSAAPAALKMSSQPAPTTAPALSGTITDPAGAVIAGASVIATNSSGALVGSVTTDSHGQYRLGDLPPGTYRIEAQARGFETQSFPAEVKPLQPAALDITLRVGAAAQTVTIEASPAPPDTSSADANQALKPAVGQTPSRFELTTDDGEHWTSVDGQTWARK
jgi:hypothetical protein